MKQLFSILIILFSFFSCQEEKKEKGEYICPPCDLPCDTLYFQKSGVCPHCKMTLIKDESTLTLNEVKLETGSGVFLIEGRNGYEKKTIKVYYHKPKNFSPESKILMVIPGAGRNGNSYRDAWIKESEKYNVLILSPKFEEKNYPFEEYHLCGLIKDLNLNESIEFSKNSNIAILKEDSLTYKSNKNRNDWLFHDFDRIFDLVINSLGTSQSKYDIFGHSAGGQILHRFAIFTNETKVDRIIAANSGFYTLPDFETKMPFGLKNTEISQEELSHSFSKKLTLLIGEFDNENENGGTLLRSNTVDEQGIHRLARAQFFYQFSKKKADKLNAKFNWEIKIVPKVGHDHKLMGDAAATILYD